MAAAPPKTSGVVVPQPLKWHGKLAATAICVVARALAASLRFAWHNPPALLRTLPPEPVIFCFWHNRLALSLHLYQRYVQQNQPTRNGAALVSASKDGAILARVLRHYDIEAVRGSSSRRGAQALLELTSCAERGYDLAITPDGPRGPRYQVQPGVIALASLTGHAIVPVAYELNWKKTLRSWDGFQIPLPFARCDVYFGEPLRVPRNLTVEERETYRLELEKRLGEISRS